MPYLDQKGRILTAQYRFIDRLPWVTIATKIHGATPNQVRNFCAQLKNRHPDASVDELVDIAGQKKRRGDTRRVKPGSNASLKIRGVIRATGAPGGQVETANDALHRMRQNDAREPLKELSNKQVHNICMDKAHCKQDPSDSRPIPRKRALEKPALEKLDLPDRERYINELLRLPAQNTLLICADETPINFGGSRHHRISAPRGEVRYIGQTKSCFTKMQWAAACADTRVPRPHKVWKTENEEDIKDLQAQLDAEMRLLAGLVDEQRSKALIPGTPEYEYMKAEQAKIDAHNAEQRQKKLRNRKHKLTPARLFPYEKLIRDNKKGGLDFAWYAFEIYVKLLFPYYKELQALNPRRTLYITEDNVPLHHKARRLLAPRIKADNIRFLIHPANSPDLHPIEHLHKTQKRLMRDFRTRISGSSKDIQQSAESEMRRVWVEDSDFTADCAVKASISYYKKLAIASKQADPAYSNRYNDNI